VVQIKTLGTQLAKAQKGGFRAFRRRQGRAGIPPEAGIPRGPLIPTTWMHARYARTDEDGSLTSLKEKPIKIGAKVVGQRDGRSLR
jgi:hypothetical protein